MEEIDIWRTAKILIDSHGEQAELQAAMRADQLLNEGDTAGFAAMKRVVSAINELDRTTIKPGERAN